MKTVLALLLLTCTLSAQTGYQNGNIVGAIPPLMGPTCNIGTVAVVTPYMGANVQIDVELWWYDDIGDLHMKPLDEKNLPAPFYAGSIEFEIPEPPTAWEQMWVHVFWTDPGNEVPTTLWRVDVVP